MMICYYKRRKDERLFLSLYYTHIGIENKTTLTLTSTIVTARVVRVTRPRTRDDVWTSSVQVGGWRTVEYLLDQPTYVKVFG